jgi:sensor histidine kinase YesM
MRRLKTGRWSDVILVAADNARLLKGAQTLVKSLLKTLAYTAVFNTAIAALLTTVGFGSGFGMTWVFSQCIGLSICLWVVIGSRLAQNTEQKTRAILSCVTIALGALTGAALGSGAMRLASMGHPFDSVFLLRVVAISIFFGLIITYFFHSREQLSASAQQVSEERIKRLASEKQLLQADLKRLQAQIEPHFLFNTLSNIVSLMDSDPPRAKQMQLDLIQYLRTSLRQSRHRTTTLAQEIALLSAYLDIYKIRMGERLRYRIDVAPQLGQCLFAPLLLQPLVENAVIHGLEPKIDGGWIHLSASRSGNWLKIEVTDNGVGMAAGNTPGVGLTNVRERLENLFTPPGRLMIEPRSSEGVRVVVEVPLNGMADATST